MMGREQNKQQNPQKANMLLIVTQLAVLGKIKLD